MPNASTNTQRNIKERILKNRRRRRLYNLSAVLFVLFLILFLAAAAGIAFQMYQDWHDARQYADLSLLVTDPPETDPPETTPDFSEPTQETASSATEETAPVGPTEPVILPRYQTVYSMNEDMFGWISIEGTPLSYPVMHTPEDEEYYLRRGFDKAYARSGVPFLDADCVTDCGNYLIYGHNMTNGTMFAQLVSYQSEKFWKEHPVIRFDTLYEEGSYEILGAFYSRVFYKYETNVFRYYDYHDLTNPDTFNTYVDWAKSQSLYDTGVTAEPGDQLITLITCSYGHSTERFVIVARKQP